MTITCNLYINGQWHDAEGRRTFTRRHPAHDEAASVAAAASLADGKRCVEAAACAFPLWRDTAPAERRRLLLEAAEQMLLREAKFIAAMAAETGATAHWAGFNVHLAADILREAAALTTQIEGQIIPSNVPGNLAMGVRQGAGVVLGMAPWNAPLILATRALATPLACGNTVILKGAELSPATQGLIIDALDAAGFPPGVVNYLTCAPEDAPALVESLIAHPAVRRVNFTGSTPVGRIIARCNALIDDALAKGARLLTGGKANDTHMSPTLLDGVTREMRLWREESFGPVKAIIRVHSEEEALAVANDSEYGLSAAVYSRDSARAWNVAQRLHTGICHINGPTVHDEAQMPFGGCKASGYGRFGGRAGIAEFTELRWITIQTQPRELPF
ncbi:TPA: aldehyde dehydrogenase family protein [Klebsiella pneumoniae]|nr:4-aminobutyraldehyde dehydrogenase [Klebsiella pneumoniae]STS03269.1 4-aminobutyraldehyde dehydrogenase [Klebsiella pneumoniae]VTN40712.1 4-aminobutyraldehyde dehydrogenase [Klebsiella pneumoniae]VTO01244.1 4-aminobutyraldehyde dehydrogenase [Klebsiella pneumoniae]HBY9771742.1 aldehyde dehydrogenase family protein [Klebsiella pneumoniae]